jgi:hypothetical protein
MKKMGKNKLPKLLNKTNYRTPHHAANVSFETLSSIVRSISWDFAHDWNDELRQAWKIGQSTWEVISSKPATSKLNIITRKAEVDNHVVKDKLFSCKYSLQTILNI